MRTAWEETSAVAKAAGHTPRPAFVDRMVPMLTTPGSNFSASMLRDIENGARVEADHVIGDLLRRRQDLGAEPEGLSLLRIAYAHLKTYENRRG